jgi:hypothetical protein
MRGLSFTIEVAFLNRIQYCSAHSRTLNFRDARFMFMMTMIARSISSFPFHDFVV